LQIKFLKVGNMQASIKTIITKFKYWGNNMKLNEGILDRGIRIIIGLVLI